MVDGQWIKELRAALAADPSQVAIASPFIKRGAVEDLLAGPEIGSLRVVTRFNLDHFSEGVSDTAALRTLMARGARIRGVKRLHAKMHLFGEARAIVTSALSWLNEQLELAFEERGKLQPAQLAALDWPTLDPAP